MPEKNYYEILQINNSAESEAIHAAYKHISKEYQYGEFALYDYTLKMQELNKAYLMLIDKDNRMEYDEGLESERASELESEEANVEVPFEIDEESAKKNKVKVESCSFYLDGGRY